ncbi:hypothetical protein Ait01nite_016510 [Actinoplanes italicus]|uniref:Nitrate/nitrite sensing protein n=1 Tax=Actinoplanes italicus TaxID=113567 RepID=A0A2T0JZ77_9ACTN|nr:hypothetical protein [Actinoplanes italicus]PRX15808.1 hypothetical protein CLV67_12247 [Actinoplanes italicus]GIE28606.1 hypothetical protein Ait01nite_016510 [Actinoplanes italicus]
MTVRAHQRQRGRPIGALARQVVPILLAVSVMALFTMVWQSADEQSDFAALERDGVRYIQALGPLEIALTNAGSGAVAGTPAAPDAMNRAVDAVNAVDRELGERLGARDRWAGLRAKIETLPADGDAAKTIAAYGTASDLLLALMDKVRNSSKLVRDPDADLYYLGDGAAQELPESIVAATRYTNLLTSLPGLSAADRAATLIDINTAASTLAGNARDLSDDVRLAVEGTGSENLGSALLSRLDRFNRSVDNLLPLVEPLKTGRGIVDAEQVSRGRDEMQAAASELSTALLEQIDIGLRDRIDSYDRRQLLAAGILVISVILACLPAGLLLVARVRGDRTPRMNDIPAPSPVSEPEDAMRRRISVP